MKRTTINAAGLGFAELNEKIRSCGAKPILVKNCLGQRYIADAASDVDIFIEGVPGNALGAYLEGGRVEVAGDAQEAVGDTMNGGEIIIHGSCGDGAGYAMRGGRIMVRGDIGYRAGIHMKEYGGQTPVMIVGGSAGSFLGEYQAGGMIIVLGLDRLDGLPPVHNFCAAGMYGGRIFLRTEKLPERLPHGVNAGWAGDEDLRDMGRQTADFCRCFSLAFDEVMNGRFAVLKPAGNNPYEKLYVNN